MSRIGEPLLLAFHDELKKFAGPMPANIGSMLGGLGAGGGVGLGAGALIGAGVGGVRNYRQAKEEGASTRQALGAGVSGALSGGQTGAIAGGVLGAAGGVGLGYASPTKAEAVRKVLTNMPGGAFARMGQRQVHSLTGWVPEGGLSGIRHGAINHVAPLQQARKELQEARSGNVPQGFMDKMMGRTSLEGAQLRKDRAAEAFQASHKAEKMGLTSIPGYAKSLKNNGVGNTLRTAFNDQWKSGATDPVSKAMLLGLPAMEVGGALMSKNEEDPLHPGEGRGQRIGKSLAGAAGMALLSPLPQITQMAAGSALTGLGSVGGRVVDKLRQHHGVVPSRPQDLTSDNGQAVPGERVVSERAAGQMGEGSPS